MSLPVNHNMDCMAHTEQGNNNQNILHILQMSVIALSTSTYKLYTKKVPKRLNKIMDTPRRNKGKKQN